MLKKLKQLNTKGFTIIEVLIVLAIAGLILLIVFLAVPALQRNSRNTQRRTEATRLLSVATEWINNNNGKLPNDGGGSICGGTGGAATNCDYTTTPNNAMQIWQLGGLKNIDGFGITAAASVTAVAPALTAGSFAQAILDTGVKCGAVTSTNVTPSTTGATARSVILIYAVENSAGNPIAQCIES